MSNELRLIKALTEALGFEIEEIQKYTQSKDFLGEVICLPSHFEYKVTKKPAKVTK